VIKEAEGNWKQVHSELIEKFKTTEEFFKTLKGKKLKTT
jgi:hypothetical protein